MRKEGRFLSNNDVFWFHQWVRQQIEPQLLMWSGEKYLIFVKVRSYWKNQLLAMLLFRCTQLY